MAAGLHGTFTQPITQGRIFIKNRRDDQISGATGASHFGWSWHSKNPGSKTWLSRTNDLKIDTYCYITWQLALL